jgi:Flp pilus assembly protein TadB
MVQLHLLWVPMLVSAVFVFVASSLIHMMLGYHRADYRRVPAEDQLMDAMRGFNISPGDYLVPCAGGPKDMKDPVFMEKFKKGPRVMMTIFGGSAQGFGKQLVQWFVYLLLVGVIVAYVTGRALPVGSPYLHVFRFAGVTAFACYAVGLWQDSIWYRRSWGTSIRYTIDGLIYAGLTAGTFGWLWPK